MKRSTILRIEGFACAYGHSWALHSDFEDFCPQKANDSEYVDTLRRMDDAAIEIEGYMMGIRAMKCFEVWSHPYERYALGGYRHITGTGRLRVDVDAEDVITLSIWRPGRVIGYPVLAVQTERDGTWGIIDIMGPAELRHWDALAYAMAAFDYQIAGTVGQLAERRLEHIAPGDILLELEAIGASAQ